MIDLEQCRGYAANLQAGGAVGAARIVRDMADEIEKLRGLLDGVREAVLAADAARRAREEGGK